MNILNQYERLYRKHMLYLIPTLTIILSLWSLIDLSNSTIEKTFSIITALVAVWLLYLYKISISKDSLISKKESLSLCLAQSFEFLYVLMMNIFRILNVPGIIWALFICVMGVTAFLIIFIKKLYK